MPIVRGIHWNTGPTRSRLALAAVALVATELVAGAAAGGQSQPRTLVSSFEVGWVAQDGALVAWSAWSKVGEEGDEIVFCDEITVLDRRTGRRTRIGYTSGRLYDEGCSVINVVLALAGKRVTWGSFNNCCNNGYGTVRTGAIGGTPVSLQSLALDGWNTGHFVNSAAGDGGTLVYAALRLDMVGGNYKFIGGEVRRVVGGKSIPLPGAPPAVLVSAAAGRLLVVPADRSSCAEGRLEAGCSPEASEGGAVEIRNAVSGRRVTRFAPRGRVIWASLSSSAAAVLVEERGVRRIEIYAPETGRRLRSTRVPRAAQEIAVADGRVVYLTPNAIHLLRTTGPRDTLLASAMNAFSLSFEERTVVWAEDGKKVDRIRELRLAG